MKTKATLTFLAAVLWAAIEKFDTNFCVLLKMFTGILIAISTLSVYISVAHATDSQPTVDSHILQLCVNTNTLTPSKIACIASVVNREY